MKKISIIVLILAILLIAFFYFISKTPNHSQASNSYNNQQTEVSMSNMVGNTTNKEYKANKHYMVIKNPVATETGDKVEVKEIFWYGCPNCYQLLTSYMPFIKQSLGDQAELIKQPAIFGNNWELRGWFFYVLDYLGETDRLHEEVFHAIHRDNINLKTKDQFIEWLEMNGVDKAKIEEATKAFSVAVNVNKAKKLAIDYQIRSVPIFVINGKYWVDAQTAGSYEEMVKVIQYLIAKELG